ncbi:hypothetical protein Hanom_Chr07g00593121 [Helianthus anomalus]
MYLISLYIELMKLLIEFLHRLLVLLAWTTCTHKSSRLNNLVILNFFNGTRAIFCIYLL